MIKLSKHPPQTSVVGGFKRKLDYGRDIEPIINKYHLENDDDCKEAVELIKKNDPQGYNQLGTFLLNTGRLTQTEEKTIFEMYEKAAEMGLEDARFNIGGLYLVGAGVSKDIEKGITLMEGAFMKVFSRVFPNYPLGSETSIRLRRLHDDFIHGLSKILEGESSRDFQKLNEGHHALRVLFGIITLIYETNDVSILF